MDRFQQMEIFVAVAEAQSFAAAARRLRLSAAAVTRAVLALEDRLGVGLLTRTTRVVRVTEAGARYLDDARRILGELQEADESAAGQRATPRGQLGVTAPVLFGKLYAMSIVTEYLDRHQDVVVSALFVDRVVNLVDEGLDVGIRIGALPDSSLRAIRVGRVRRVTVAAPDYLARQGTPGSPEELQLHQTIVATGVTPIPEWSFDDPGGRRTVRLKPRIIVNTNDGALEAARRAFGLARLLSYQAAPLLASGELVRVLEPFEGADLPVHVVHREGRLGSAKVRSFVDLAVERLRADRALN